MSKITDLNTEIKSLEVEIDNLCSKYQEEAYKRLSYIFEGEANDNLSDHLDYVSRNDAFEIDFDDYKFDPDKIANEFLEGCVESIDETYGSGRGYGNAIEYLAEHDPSLYKSLSIADDMGLSISYLNSEVLADLLENEADKNELWSWKDTISYEIEKLYDDYNAEYDQLNEKLDCLKEELESLNEDEEDDE